MTNGSISKCLQPVKLAQSAASSRWYMHLCHFQMFVFLAVWNVEKIPGNRLVQQK